MMHGLSVGNSFRYGVKDIRNRSSMKFLTQGVVFCRD
jgi:hypothetical protein